MVRIVDPIGEGRIEGPVVQLEEVVEAAEVGRSEVPDRILHDGHVIRSVPTGRESIHLELAEQAKALRNEVLPGKRIGKGNISAGQLTLGDGQTILQQATSRRKGPIQDIPKTKFEGSNFVPTWITDRNGVVRLMDSDAEFKLFDFYANYLKSLPTNRQSGTLDLFTEMSMCTSCFGVRSQFEKMFPNIKVNVSNKIEY